MCVCYRTRITRIARIWHDAAPVRHPDESFGLTQKARKAQKGTTLRPCGLRGGINCLTQTSQKTQNFSINANLDSNLDTNTQKTHTQACASHPDGTRERSVVGLAKGIVLL